MRKGNSSIATMNLLVRKIWSNFFYFYICYQAGGSTKHLPRPEVKRRKEESSPKDALTPKEGKTRFAGKMRTYLWVCPVTPPPTPSSFPLPLKNKYAWIQQNGMNRCNTYYSLSPHLDALL